jgi:HD-GYP domain-containing protein (c-di-GMP phosphodiesterase class II)
MPIMMHVNSLEPGMQLARNLVNNYNVLLPHGRRLTANDITALQRRYPDLSVLIIDPILDDTFEFQDDGHDLEISRKVRQNVDHLVKKVSDTIRQGVHLKAENIVGIQDTIIEMIKFLIENPVTMAVVEQSHSWHDYLQEHSANVFYLSLVIGNTMRNFVKQERERQSIAKHIRDAMDLTPLATAALFHDIGMVPIENVYSKKEPLTDEEVQKIREHPRVGAAMLPEQVHPMAKLAVASHHECSNGQGYPEGISADKICVFGRILRIADAYSAAIATKVFQQAKSPIQALYEMLHGRYRDYYDPVILKVFTSIMQPIPVGAKIKLNTGAWGVVVRHNPRSPFDPYLIVAFDALGDPLPHESLDSPFRLSENPDVKAASYNGEDISFINNLPLEADPAEDAALHEKDLTTVFELTYP